MINFILNIALLDMIAGRGLFKADTVTCRCIVPAILAGIISNSFVAFMIVLGGSAIYFSSGWSFDELSGDFSKDKYHPTIRKIGALLIKKYSPESNKIRGAIMKGIRHLYDMPTFITLSFFFNSISWLLGLAMFFCGFLFYAAGKIAPGKSSAMFGDFLRGALRGTLIYFALGL